MKAKDLLNLLAQKHSKDVFVPECKTGPSQTGEPCPRMDAWAMRRSWAHPHTYGYEIKVSRSDFVGDDKWHSYLPYCSHFSFVVAPGVCDPSEVPEGCGLLQVSSTGTKLFTKRKAPRREVTIPESLWRYVLMARSEVTSQDTLRYGRDKDRFAYWKAWLAEKAEKQEIGWRVSKRLNQLHREKVTEVESEQIRLRAEIQKLGSTQALLDSLGVDVHDWRRDEKVRELIENRKARIDKRTVNTAKRIAKEAGNLAALLAGDEP